MIGSPAPQSPPLRLSRAAPRQAARPVRPGRHPAAARPRRRGRAWRPPVLGRRHLRLRRRQALRPPRPCRPARGQQPGVIAGPVATSRAGHQPCWRLRARRLRARPLRARRQPALAEKGALPLTGAPGADGPGGCLRSRVEAVRRPRPPQWAAGRPVACLHRRNNQPARVNTTLLLAVLVGGIVNVTRR
jgi:hypothetical protein